MLITSAQKLRDVNNFCTKAKVIKILQRATFLCCAYQLALSSSAGMMQGTRPLLVGTTRSGSLSASHTKPINCSLLT
jgi:hypothetical protein